MLKKIYFIFTLFCFMNTAIIAQNIAPSIQEKMVLAQSTDQIACFIKLKTQANLQAANTLKTKKEKGAYVFQTLKSIAEKTQAPILSYLQTQGIKYQSFYIANAIYIEATKSQIEFLASWHIIDAIVANSNFISPNTLTQENILKAQTLALQNTNANTWGLDTIKAPNLWQLGFQGQGVVIGGQDTGYEYLHPSIRQQYRGYNNGNYTHDYNWHDAIHAAHPFNADNNNPCGFDALAPCDDNTHGTHTMGTMVGNESPISNLKIGVAPQAQWIGCRNMERGWGTAQTYIECFEWFLAPTNLNNQAPNTDLAPHIIANSWGCPPIEGCDSTSIALMNIVVDNLVQAGIFVVVSAGNDGPDCNTIMHPATIYNSSFVVGASNENDAIAEFSSRGLVQVLDHVEMKPNVVAPGVNILSSIYGNWEASYQGTSMAGPHVAGAAALLISAKPSLAGQTDSLKLLLQNTAKPIYSIQSCNGISGNAHPNPIAGHGRIDVLAAYQAINFDDEIAVQNALSPTKLNLYPNPAQNNITIALPENLIHFHLSITNTLGQKIYTQHLENQSTLYTLNIENLAHGFYTIQLIDPNNNHYYQGKFIKG